MIKPIVAGQFYPAGKTALTKQIEECFASSISPPEKAGKLFGVIAPHAGYIYSGFAAARSYKAIAESKAKTFVILAPDHNGTCFAPTIANDDFETPLGIAKTDKKLVGALLKKCEFLKQGIIHEHAVEVQLPFLQYLFRQDFSIVSIVIPSPKNYRELGKAIAEVCKNCIVIASSDFTHYGYNYGFMPFPAKEAKLGMRKMDLGAIKFIENLDAGGFMKYVEKTGATICGEYAIAAAIEAVKSMKSKKAELLTYYTSADIGGDYSGAVGYAAVAFR